METEKFKCTIFVDPDRLQSVIQELTCYDLDIVEIDGAGPEACIVFLGTEEDIESFIEENSFEITNDSIMYEALNDE